MKPGAAMKLFLYLFFCSVAVAQAQTPQQLPLVQAGNFVHLGVIHAPGGLGSGQNSMAVDGNRWYFGCYQGVAVLSVPPMGGTASVISPCSSLPNIDQVHPTDRHVITGGILPWAGRLIASVFVYYDGGHGAVASHYAGADAASLAGPVRVGTDRVGMVAGYMGVIPQEWRALLGGPALTGQCCIPIISRSSFGPSFSVFDPADIGTKSAVPSKMLVGYPDEHKGLGPWDASPPNIYYGGTDQLGSVAFPPGTRSILLTGRHGDAWCYGPGTADPAVVGTPHPVTGLRYCYDPTDEYQGNHGPPYRPMVWAYDANDALAVKQGTKQPWDVKPYAKWALPGMPTTGTNLMRSGFYDPATRRYYVGATDSLDVHVFEVTNAAIQPPPPVEVCGDGIDNDGDGLIDEDCAPAVEVCGDGIDNDGDGLIDEGCADLTAAPGAPVRLVGTVRSSTVSFTWSAALTGGAVSEYVLEAGLAPGLPAYVAPMGLMSQASFPNIGTGRYYVRVRARNNNGQSPPSNEVTVSVGCGNRPRNVSSLQAVSNQGLVTLTWTDPDGCSGTTYQVAVGTTPGAADVQMLSAVGNSTTTLLSAGTYYARVAAIADSGISDPTDLQFTVRQSGCAVPRFRTGLTSLVVGRAVSLWWSPLEPDVAKEDDGVAPVSYVIEAGSVSGAADIGAAPTGRNSSFFTAAPPGIYFVRVRPVNTCGAGRPSSDVRVEVR